MLQTEGVANGHHEIPHLDLGRIAERDLGESVGLDLEHGNIGGLV